MDLRHVGSGGPGQGFEALRHALHPELRGEVHGDVVGIVVAHGLVVGGGDVAFGRVDGPRQFFEGDVALPLVFARSSRERAASR